MIAARCCSPFCKRAAWRDGRCRRCWHSLANLTAAGLVEDLDADARAKSAAALRELERAGVAAPTVDLFPADAARAARVVELGPLFRDLET
jgi:hypothetical protein